MPSLRSRVANLILGPEARKLESSVKQLMDAYELGPFQLPPDELMRQLKEIDSAVVADLLAQAQYDYLGSFSSTYQTFSEAARKRAIDESRRLWQYAPLGQWAIQTWTNFGLGEAVQIVCEDPDAQETWEECWTADRNAELFADDRIQELSNWTLVDGNTFLAAFSSNQDGEVTWAEIPCDEVVEILTDPNNVRRPIFYKRQFLENKKSRVLYYPDWQTYFNSPEDLDRFDLPRDGERADKVNEATPVCVVHIAHNRKARNSLWGWPILGIAAPYTRAHKKFVEDRLTISAAKAMYVRRAKVQGGSRAVAAVRAKLQSTLSSSNYAETNPPAASGSTLIENGAVDTTDLPMTTGASDAKADNEMFAWMSLLGMGLFPTSAGLDTSRWATALAMDKTQSMQWSRYQTFWSAQFQKIVTVTLDYKEKFGSTVFQSKKALVSIDSFSIVDLPGVVSALSPLVSGMLAPLIEKGIMPTPAGTAIAQQLWRVVLKALGLDDEKLTDDETFGIGNSEQNPVPPPVKEMLERVVQKLGNGQVDPNAAAEFMMAEIMDYVRHR